MYLVHLCFNNMVLLAILHCEFEYLNEKLPNKWITTCELF